MPHYNYLIIGGGMTADAAVQGIRAVDAKGTVGLISSESNPPYNRPPLSKGLWKGEPVENIWRKTETRGVELHLGREAKQLDAKNHQATDDRGTIYTFDKLLLATGARVRKLPFGVEHIIYYRTLDDYHRLRAMAGEGKQFAVIGGGFIGWEVAAALAMNGSKVSMLFPDEGIGARLYPRELSQFLNAFYREKGVEVFPGEAAVALQESGGGLRLEAKSGRAFQVGGGVAGIGVQPNTELAQAAGLKTGNGVAVNENLQTSHADIYAAGDVAEFANPALGRRLRVEHEDNANTMGLAAGQNMAGQSAPYHHLPFFYTDLFDLGYEAVGDLDSRLETYADWKATFREGVVYYLAGGRVRGVLVWNTWGQVDNARRLIAEPGPFKASDLKGRLPA